MPCLCLGIYVWEQPDEIYSFSYSDLGQIQEYPIYEEELENLLSMRARREVVWALRRK